MQMGSVEQRRRKLQAYEASLAVVADDVKLSKLPLQIWFSRQASDLLEVCNENMLSRGVVRGWYAFKFVENNTSTCVCLQRLGKASRRY
jgi:hypothetical protein